MTSGIDWVSASAFLLSGVVIGVMFIYYIMTSSRDKAASSDIEERDLAAKVDALVLRLREQEDGGDFGERERLEAEAATALRRLAELGGSVPDAAQKSPLRPAVQQQRSFGAVAGFLWGVGSMAVLALLGYMVYSASSTRQAGEPAVGGQPPDGAGGAPPMAAAGAQRSAADPDVIRLRQELKQSPNDISKRLELTERELVLEDLISVHTDAAEVLKRDPNNAQAMTYEGFVLMAMGRSSEAEATLNRALAIDPDLIDAWIQLAVLDVHLGRESDAEKAVQEAVKRRPDQEQAIRNLVAQMRSRSGAGSPEPPVAPQASPASPETGEPPASPAESISGTIDVPANPAPTAVLFVFAREAGVSSGPPVAVARLQPSPGKMTFELTAANSMMGQALPSKLRVEARLDTDGNAMTHDPSDLIAVADNVSIGTHNLELRLKQGN